MGWEIVPPAREEARTDCRTTQRHEFQRSLKNSQYVPQVRARFLGANLGAADW
jgi:hypothetical protein